jgi:diaminopimelate decarboxylase
VGGCDLVELARDHGTPLYVYDEATVRLRCREYVAAMGDRGEVLYSAKAFASPGFLRVVASEGLGLDVVSAGELHVALAAGYPTERLHFLGNNKSADDVAAAWAARAILVIDGLQDLDLLRGVVPAGSRMRCQVRVSPGVQPATHDYISTGQLDSKFGFSVESGARRDLGFEPARIGAGGGLGIAYTRDDDPPTPAQFVRTLLAALDEGCALRGLRTPLLVVEPGRSIAGPAGVALYTVGAIKDIPGVRRYVAVDGGMGDNIRPKLYGARYEVLLASDPEAARNGLVTIAGKYCESTDVLVADADLPPVAPGDVVCVPAAGAYCLAMASNYNGLPRPAVVMARGGVARLIRRRETLDDLLTAEIL